MDCGFCISVDLDDGGYEDYRNGIAVAEVEKKCCECNTVIHVGDTFEWARGVLEDEEHSHSTCLVCAEIADAFCCDGRRHGTLWEALENTIDQDETIITTACYARLKTAAAKLELQRFWRSVIGLDGKRKV